MSGAALATPVVADGAWPVDLSDDERAAARLIPLWHNGNPVAWAIVDADVFPALAAWRWHLGTGGYAVRRGHISGTQFNLRMHRVVMCLTPHDGFEIDHLNRCRLDNRRSNLRYVTPSQNALNRGNVTQPRRRLPAPEPRWHKRDRRWDAEFSRKVDGTVYRIYAGRFTDRDEAAAALSAAYEEFLREHPYD